MRIPLALFAFSAATLLACGPSPAMLNLTYPPKAGGVCWEYMGSVVVVDFVDESERLVETGLPEMPLEFSLQDPNLAVMINSRTTVTDFSDVCDVIVSHFWLQITPCEDPDGWERDQVEKLTKRYPKVKVGFDPVGTGLSYFRRGPFEKPAGDRGPGAPPRGGPGDGKADADAERAAILKAIHDVMAAGKKRK